MGGLIKPNQSHSLQTIISFQKTVDYSVKKLGKSAKDYDRWLFLYLCCQFNL